MKFLKKLLMVSLALVCFVGGNTTFGGITTAKATETKKELKSVFSIDAGRKYFSEDQLKQIIDKAYHNGYTDVQLILGNDALRFFLDDMSITVNGTTYESEAVKEAMTEGNKVYYDDPNGNALTETEMDRILAYAKERGIGIIPLINSPGHMDSILKGMEVLGMEEVRFENNGKKSERTVNLRNEDAITFTHELVKKYAVYFGNSGASEMFNFGADEYANDVFTNPGWSELQNLGLYDKFIDYANALAGIIKAEGMKPVCFNDGIYYNSNDTFGTFDKEIIISYWTSGWWGFNVAKPSYLVNKGHEILNTNDAWYWVLGNIAEGGYPYNNTIKNIESKGFNDVTGAGAGEVIPTIGSMQAVWCDNPSMEHDMDRIMDLMDRFSTKHADIMIRPADYSKVDEALENVPADLSLYTDETRAVLETAIANVDRTKKADEQDVVDAYAEAINKAVENLVYREADYTKVDAAIKKAESLKKDDYKDFSAVEKAIEAVKRGLDITNQEEVDAMAKAIEDAIAGLEAKPSIPGTDKPGNVETGDTSNTVLWTTSLLASLGLAGYVLVKRRKEQN